jgi:hypothetical protein
MMKVLWVAVLGLVMGCGVAVEPPAPDEPALTTRQDELRVAVGPRGIAYDFAHRDTLTRGIAGDERYVFVGEVFAGRVVVLNRFTGEQEGVLPTPPQGWGLLFGPKLLRPGLLYVLDAGAFPAPGVLANARVHLYRYWHDSAGFHAIIVRTDDFTAAFAQAGFQSAFASDLAVLPDGGYILTEQITGSLWRVTPSGQILRGVVPRSGAMQDAIPQLAGCLFPAGTVVNFAGVPFSFFGDFAPGANYVATNGHELFWESPCQQAIFALPLWVFYDFRQPWERINSARVVSRATKRAEILGGMAFNPYDPFDHGLYVADPYVSRITRVNTVTGVREAVVSDPVLFNAPANVAFLPPVLGVTPLMVASSQEHRLAAINSQLSQDIVQPPWVVTKIVLTR